MVRYGHYPWRVTVYMGMGAVCENLTHGLPILNPTPTQTGKDHKLKPHEHQHCFDQHLCLYCGNPGHSIKDCPKPTSATSNAKSDQDVTSECTALLGWRLGFGWVSDSGFSLCAAPTY